MPGLGRRRGLRLLWRGQLPGVKFAGSGLGGVAGALAEGIGLRNTLWVGAVGQLLAIVWLLASPMRSLRDFPDT